MGNALSVPFIVSCQNVKGTKILFFSYILLSFLVCTDTDSKVQTGATLFKTALKVELFRVLMEGR